MIVLIHRTPRMGCSTDFGESRQSIMPVIIPIEFKAVSTWKPEVLPSPARRRGNATSGRTVMRIYPNRRLVRLVDRPRIDFPARNKFRP